MEPCSKKMIKDYVRVLNSEQKDHLPLVHFEWFESSKWMNKVKSMTYELYEHRFFSWFSYQNKSRFFSSKFTFFVCVFSLGLCASLEETFMEQPRYFLNVCDSVLSWIDEGKLPEQNAAGFFKMGVCCKPGSFPSLSYGTFRIFSFLLRNGEARYYFQTKGVWVGSLLKEEVWLMNWI